MAETKERLIEAARRLTLEDGFAGLSTRRVAEEAAVPLSQLHYHFGSKQNLVLALLRSENERLLERQASMYGVAAPLWKRWEQACDFLDDDLGSGYVRVLHEAIAAGWSNEEFASEVRVLLQGWFDLLDEVASEAERELGTFGPLTPREVATLVATAFLGGEAVVLLGMPDAVAPARTALRRVAELIRQREEAET